MRVNLCEIVLLLGHNIGARFDHEVICVKMFFMLPTTNTTTKNENKRHEKTTMP
jgi:hypothetical protein